MMIAKTLNDLHQHPTVKREEPRCDCQRGAAKARGLPIATSEAKFWNLRLRTRLDRPMIALICSLQIILKATIATSYVPFGCCGTTPA